MMKEKTKPDKGLWLRTQLTRQLERLRDNSIKAGEDEAHAWSSYLDMKEWVMSASRAQLLKISPRMHAWRLFHNDAVPSLKGLE